MTTAAPTRTQKSYPGGLERITLEMTSTLDLQRVLNTIAEGLVEDLDALFARIWLLGPGDLCAGCFKAGDCSTPAPGFYHQLEYDR